MINKVLRNISLAKEILTDLEQRIKYDLSLPTKNSRYLYGTKSSKRDIERTCLMARKYLKNCYGDNYRYVDEIIEEVKEPC